MPNIANKSPGAAVPAKFPGAAAVAEKSPDAAIVAEQAGYAARVRELLSASPPPAAYVRTFGCQQNVSDGERLRGTIAAMGYRFTGDPAEADLILLNTCAVREHAEDRVFGFLGTFKKLMDERPSRILAVCGCMAREGHIAEKLRRSFPYVSICFGPQHRHRLAEFVYRRLTTGERIFESGEGRDAPVEGMPTFREGGYTAFLPIMSGCDNFCSYCVVPYVRGREVSRRPEDILREAEGLIASGVKEITLLGQNVNSYGAKEDFGADFSDLLVMLNDLPGDFRLRFMTSHPKDCGEKLLRTMAGCGKVCRHLHLPVQCGGDRILRLMNRRYTAGEYIRLADRARELIPGLTLTSDIIVGFPGETYEDFLDTLKLLRRVRFYSLFTFIYSPRVGTPAAAMEDPVPREEKSRWFRELLAAEEEISEGQNEMFAGRVEKVLCEEYDPVSGRVSGHTGTFATVSFPGDGELLGLFVNVRITGTGRNMTGEIVKEDKI